MSSVMLSFVGKKKQRVLLPPAAEKYVFRTA